MALSWWHPPGDVAGLPPVQRVTFALACAEHVLPSFELQVQVYPESLPAGLSTGHYNDCLNAFWGWASDSASGTRMPTCITKEDTYRAHRGADEGFSFLVTNAYGILWCARMAFHSGEHVVSAGSQALEVVAELVPYFVSPRAGSEEPYEDARLQAEWEGLVAAHELARLASRAQADAFQALSGGASVAELRPPAQAVGQQIAAWTAQEL